METVIFSSVWSIALSALILVLYIAAFVVKKAVKAEKTARLITTLLTAFNITAHAALFIVCAALKAPASEVFFLLVASSALALTLIKEKEPRAEQGKEEK